MIFYRDSARLGYAKNKKTKNKTNSSTPPLLDVSVVRLTWAGAADRRCLLVLKLAGGGAGSTGGRMLGGTISSLLVTSGTLNKTVMLLMLTSQQELVDSVRK